MLTGKEIASRGIITGYDAEKAVQQQGIDLRIKSIREVGGTGAIYRDRTCIPGSPVQVTKIGNMYVLEPGYYEIEFMEGVALPSTNAMWLKSRSSLVRCGGQIVSGQFDAGFATSNIGAFLKVHHKLCIEDGARVAQAVIFCSNEVQNTYNGQFQGDKQRT